MTNLSARADLNTENRTGRETERQRQGKVKRHELSMVAHNTTAYSHKRRYHKLKNKKKDKANHMLRELVTNSGEWVHLKAEKISSICWLCESNACTFLGVFLYLHNV